jgi:SPP1 family phage portal protein
MAVMSVIPETLDTLGPGGAAGWASTNAEWLKIVFEAHDKWIKDALIDKYQAVYDGKMDSIDTRDKARGDDVNNKLFANMAGMIIDTVVDYMLGKRIVWTVDATSTQVVIDGKEQVADEALVEMYRNDIMEILQSDDMHRVLCEQLRQGGIAGYSAVICWVDEYGKIKMEEYPVQEVIPIYDTRGRLRLVIRKFLVVTGEVKTTNVEVYDKRFVTYYVGNEKGEELKLDPIELLTGNPVEHKAARIPVSIFTNGTPAAYEARKAKAGTSDLGNGVLSLIENYAAVMSDKANTAENLLDQYLVLKGVDTDENEVLKMRKARAIALKSKDSDASFIAPQQNDEAIENHLDRVQSTIHDMTFIPKLNGISGATAMEIRMKYSTLDIKAGKKETYFNNAIHDLVSIITDMLNCKMLTATGTAETYELIAAKPTIDEAVATAVALYSVDWLDYTINRNLPQNFQEIAGIVSTLAGIVPDSYLYGLLWFIEDPVAALAEMKIQKAQALKDSIAAMGYGSEFADTGDTAADPATAATATVTK